ncbi:MAG: hypothetical protein IPL40_08910 [Proteobacteria bacterium]|nr:hypothetical protein [Pseudomonadota bacterium]
MRAQWNPGGALALQAVTLADDGSVWLAAEDRGALRLTKRGRWEVFDRAAGRFAPIAALPDAWLLHVSAEREANGAVRGLWIGTQGGAARLGSDGKVTAQRALPDPKVHAVPSTSTGVWLGTEGGTLLLPADAG